MCACSLVYISEKHTVIWSFYMYIIWQQMQFIDYSQMFFLSHSVTAKPRSLSTIKDSRVGHVVTARIQVLVSNTNHFPRTEHLPLHSYTFQNVLSVSHMHTLTWTMLLISGHSDLYENLVTRPLGSEADLCFSWNSSPPAKQMMFNLSGWLKFLVLIKVKQM